MWSLSVAASDLQTFGNQLSMIKLLVPWSRKGRAILLLPLWAVRPVQSLSACTSGALYLYFMYVFMPSLYFSFFSSFPLSVDPSFISLSHFVVYLFPIFKSLSACTRGALYLYFMCVFMPSLYFSFFSSFPLSIDPSFISLSHFVVYLFPIFIHYYCMFILSVFASIT